MQGDISDVGVWGPHILQLFVLSLTSSVCDLSLSVELDMFCEVPASSSLPRGSISSLNCKHVGAITQLLGSSC